MLQTLSTVLNNIKTKSKQEIYQLSNNLNNPDQTKHNMLHQVRPEVFNQILIFLDIQQILQFRLVSRRANETIKLMLPKQIHNLQYLIVEQQNEIQVKIQILEATKNPNQQQDLQAALNQISEIPRSRFVELKHYAQPPEIIEKVITLVCLATDSTFKIQKDNWKECQKRLGQGNFINSILYLDISILKEKQLKYLEQVNSYTEEQTASKSLVVRALLIFLKAVVELRKSNLYKMFDEITELEHKIRKKKQFIVNLEKINDN
ncbi:unnamed protein product [Paramecium octaurelia]|uniref:F-box domain-containing protein n=1 Tax=Paramecium octaurelia TaxID=43137 RepID=A0A8S1XGI2_PAROT|nr:unnamed protein product [Paramecium octaurelia]